jgi:DNA-binding HxlR family transcriptional regulator
VKLLKQPAELDPKVEALVREIVGRVAGKWTMILLENLVEHGKLRFTRLGELAGNISQKMLTKTIRQMERDGLVIARFTCHSAQGQYELTPLGYTLARPVAVWLWAEGTQGN